MKVISYNSSEQLSEHFNAREFRCKCGREHNFHIDENLVSKLEMLYSKLQNSKWGCSKIIVTSGYRCTDHDKAVGGSGTGQHTKGYASDIICYESNGNPIPSHVICCIAQDCGFAGIGKIDGTATHVDTRMFGGWKGDETLPNGAGTNYSVTTDYYDYFSMDKKKVYGDGDITTNPKPVKQESDVTITYELTKVKEITIKDGKVTLVLNGKT